MNLFESKIEQLKTRDNSTYLEAVSKIFGILFESVFENPFPNAGALIRSNPREALITFAKQCAEQLEKLRNTSKFFYNLNDRKAIAAINGAADAPNYVTDEMLYNWVSNAMNAFREVAISEDADSFDNLPVTLEERKAGLEFKNFVEKFCDEVLPKFKELAPDFVAYGGKKKTKMVNVSKELFADQPEAGAEGEAAPEVVPADAEAGAPVKTKKKGSKKEDKPEDKEEAENAAFERYAAYIDGDIGGYLGNFTDTDNFIVLHDVDNPDSVISRMTEGLDAIVKNKAGSGTSPFSKDVIKFESNPETHEVIIRYDTSWANGDMTKNTCNNVLMYCLYLDVKNRFGLGKADISDAVARSIAFDMRPRAKNPDKKGAVTGGGNSALRRLIGQKNADAMAAVGTISPEILVSQMPKIAAIDDSVKLQLANTIKSYLSTIGKKAVEDQISAKEENDAESLNRFRESFNTGVVELFANKLNKVNADIKASLMSSGDDPITTEDADGLNQTDVEQFFKFLNMTDENGQTIYDKVLDDLTMTGLTTVTVGADKSGVGGHQVVKADDRITPDTYNGQASTVVDINLNAQKSDSPSYTRYSRKAKPSKGLSAEELASRYDFSNLDKPAEGSGLIKTKKVRR